MEVPLPQTIENEKKICRSNKDLFRIQKNSLKLMGHNFNEDTTVSWPRKLQYMITFLIVITSEGPIMHYTIYYIDDMILATSSLSIMLTNMITVVKFATFLYYKSEFIELTFTISSIYDKINTPIAKGYLLTSNRIASNLVKIYFAGCSMTGLYFMLTPFIKFIWSKLMMQQYIRDLPMPMRFPFDFLTSPGYEVAYIYTAFSTLIVVIYAASIDNTFLTVTFNLRGHFQALQYFVRTNRFLKSDDECSKDIKSFIQYHNLLLDLCAKVGKIYKPIIFAQFLMTSLQLCVILFQLVTNIGAVFSFIIYCTFLLTIMIQLLIYCYGGEILRTESLNVANAIELSDWYNLSPSNRHMLMFVMHRAQKQIIFKSGFYQLSLGNFMTILKASMSYITLLQSIE